MKKIIIFIILLSGINLINADKFAECKEVPCNAAGKAYYQSLTDLSNIKAEIMRIIRTNEGVNSKMPEPILKAITTSDGFSITIISNFPDNYNPLIMKYVESLTTNQVNEIDTLLKKSIKLVTNSEEKRRAFEACVTSCVVWK